MRISTD